MGFRNFAFELLDEKNINKYTRYSLLITLFQILSLKFSQGEIPYQKYAFEIFRKLLEYKLFDGQISTLRTVIMVSAQLKEINWMVDFVKENLIKIDPQNQETMQKHFLSGTEIFY